MVEKKDKSRYEEAKSCKDCLGWHKHCKAECCKTIFLRIKKSENDAAPGNYYVLKIGRELSPSDQRYYRLHDVRYTRMTLRFLKSRIYEIGGDVFYVYPCSLLDKNNLCTEHGKNKPKICKELTEETASKPNNRFMLTNNCLFKYKEKGGSKNG